MFNTGSLITCQAKQEGTGKYETNTVKLLIKGEYNKNEYIEDAYLSFQLKIIWKM